MGSGPSAVATLAVVSSVAPGWNADFDVGEDGTFHNIAFPSDGSIAVYDDGWGIRGSKNGTLFSMLNHDLDVVHASLVSGQPGSSLRVLTTSTNTVKASGIVVSHEFYNSPANEHLIEVLVTITNSGTAPVDELLYRRRNDIDVAGNQDYLHVVSGATAAPHLLYLETRCCGSTDPHSPTENTAPADYFDQSGDFTTTITLQFGAMAPGSSIQFTLFYGGVPDKTTASSVMTALNPDLTWIQSDLDNPSGDAYLFGYTGTQTDPAPAPDCSVCSPYAFCTVEGSGDVSCTCANGFEDVHGNATVCIDVDECMDDAYMSQCDHLAYCENSPGTWACVCPEGFFGNGTTCANDAFGIRTVATIPGVDSFLPAQLETLKVLYASIVTGEAKFKNDSIVETMPTFSGAYAFGSRLLGVSEGPSTGNQITLWALFETFDEANATLAALSAPNWAAMGVTSIEDGPAVYRWSGGSTSDALEIPPTGLSVDSVVFDASCLSSGCWKVNVTYTKGSDDFNVFFVPNANGADTLSYDPIYTDLDATWGISEAATFEPSNHPCTTADYDPSSGNLPAAITACCIPEFLSMYRPVDAFETALNALVGLNLSAGVCGEGDRTRAVTRTTVPWFVKFGETASEPSSFPPPASPSVVDNVFVDGTFAGLTYSNIYHTKVVDSYIGIYQATLELDEVELRSMAGQRKGTIGVEHTVDTFVGIVNFSPTGSKVLDTFATQQAIHLEKTSFFSVSTHGVNDYTFLEYINMRLVTVYNQDKDFSGAGPSTGASAGGANDDESAAGIVRTNSTANVCYVQVTFTMGSQYEPNRQSGGLIPLDSVRAGKGTFFADVNSGTPTSSGDLTHVCDGYMTSQTLGVYGYEVDKSTFMTQVAQDSCGPKSAMCSSPMSVPDQFVSFNVPLGKEVFEDPSNDLSNNIFVHLVINAVDTVAAGTPNNGDDPKQVKTTLSASIPIVTGGVHVFCDGVTAKTDLKDVANADVIVGSAKNEDELTRLRILEDIASTQLAEDDATDNLIDSDSIEAGLLTIVVKGNASYFASGISGSNTLGYSMELDDVITIHIMEDGEAPTATQGDGSAMGTMMELLATPADDNSDSNGLDTDGYQLNGAFSFTVVRNAAPGESRALLEPTVALTAVCPFNPPRPTPGTTPLETCITRRDVRSRGYPARTGAAESTAMEIAPWNLAGAASPAAMTDAQVDSYLSGLSPSGARESEFMVSILGDNDYAKQLAIDYAKTLHERYTLNGRYTRAYWINPGYEWTPTQTAGKSLFQISQKIYLFALISLDENWPVRRRMLLQTATSNDKLQENSAGVGKTEVGFNVNPTSLLAQAFEVPPDKVAKFEVEVQLTKAEACMSPSARQSALMATFDDYMTGATSAYHTVQVTSMTLEMNGESCDRRRRQLKDDFSSATAVVSMVVVFKEEAESKFNIAAFAAKPGIQAVHPAESNTAIEYPDDFVAEPSQTSDDSSSSLVPIIAGVVGGVCGVVLLAGLGVFFFRRSSAEHEVAPAVQSINVADLKAQLAGNV